ncbi:MAG TPA: DUF433 domain-containing protein [Bryobacteraceae bacterium]|nr:DUF433 domain-containing protein [Bryobacteraceae bacterium]
MDLKARIIIDPAILMGKPVVTGTRISVEFIVDLLAAGWTHEQILKNYPHLSEDDILACLHYAGELLHNERVYPLTSA